MHRARRRTCWFVIAILGMASVARAQPAETEGATGPEPAPMNAAAKARYDQGLELYGRRNFRAAIEEFEEGFAIEPRREFLFAEAQAYRLAGDCAHAVPLFNRFLETQPSAIQIDATRLALDRCAHQPPPPKVEARPPEARVLPQPRPPIPEPPPPRAWWRDPWGLGALGGAVVAAGVGGGFLLASGQAWDAAHAPTVHLATDFDRMIDDYERRHTVGVASLATGAVLLAAGVGRFAYVRHRNRSASERVTSLIEVSPLPQGAALWMKGTF
jgi:tetratricopeptide (TPR) repeat protein